jgi:bla regulator protein blaR1
MNMSADTLNHFVGTSLAKAIGWTLFHSLWEGAIVAIALIAALSVLRSSRARYAAACLAMLLIVAGFIGTLLFVQHETGLKGTSFNLTIPPAPPGDGLNLRNQFERLNASDVLSWLAPFWLAGVILFHLRALAGWIAARRLGRRGVCRAPELWQERLIELRARIRLSKAVALLESSLAEVPVVVGYLRPAILAPVGMLAGMSANQVEAILLHELAHIRRRDYLANLFQTVVEGFLFYHPAVWWISGVIRAERENCCDDLVVAANGNAPEYAAALTALEQTRWTAHDAALAATGGNLMKRIRRLLYPGENPRLALTPVVSAGILAIAAALALMAWQSPAPVADSPSQAWLDNEAAYIITDAERAAFRNLQSEAERQKFIEQFWERRDPTPGTIENEFKEEHYRRIGYANARFGSRTGIPGSKTDRGRIYITFGPPDEIDEHPSGGAYSRPAAEGGGQTTTVPFVDWLYRYIEGIGNNIMIEFVDPDGNGEYHMSRDPHPPA